MKLNLTFGKALCGKALCYASVFRINGVDADEDDFGVKYDRSPATAEDYGCGDMQFTRIPAKPEVLKKYRISMKQYEMIASKLEEGLSFGKCGWCI